MKAQTTLHLLIPGLLGPMPQPDAAGHARDLPRLARLLSRSAQRSQPGSDYFSTLFSLFGHRPGPDRDLPEGAVNCLGEGLEAAVQGCWMRADPVHLRADRDRLLLFHAAGLAISQAEAAEVTRRFNDHFAGEGLQLFAPHARRWYLRMEECPDLRTHPLGEVSGRDLDQYMPKGGHARRWRRLGNEMQMLLYHAPFNQQREEEGRPLINGIWLSGVGPLPARTAVQFTRAYGDDPGLTGLARLHGIPCHAPPEDWEALWMEGGDILMVSGELLPLVWDADALAWAQALLQIEERLHGLVCAMSRQRGRLALYTGDGRCFWVTPGLQRRFWRRTRRLGQWLAR